MLNRYVLIVSLLFIGTLFALPAEARTLCGELPGLCGDVTSDGAHTTTDALKILKKAVGHKVKLECECLDPEGECPLYRAILCGDADGDGIIRAKDALRILKVAVKQSDVELLCDTYCPDPTTTTTTSTTLPTPTTTVEVTTTFEVTTTTLPPTTTTTEPTTTTTVEPTTTTIPPTTTTVEPTTTTIPPTTTTVPETTTTIPEETTTTSLPQETTTTLPPETTTTLPIVTTTMPPPTTTSTTLPPPECGNGVVEAGEECEVDADKSACTGRCKATCRCWDALTNKNRSSVDRADVSSEMKAKVIYAIASDGTDYALDKTDHIVNFIRSGALWFMGESKGVVPRFDMFDCDGKECLDVQFVRLEASQNELFQTGFGIRTAVEDELDRRGITVDPTEAHLVVYDGPAQGHCGSGTWHPHLRGSVVALFIGGNTGDQYCPRSLFGISPTSLNYWSAGWVHEFFHLLGAVGFGAPNFSFTAPPHVGDFEENAPNDLMYAGTRVWDPKYVDVGAGTPGGDDYAYDIDTLHDYVNVYRSAIFDPSIPDAEYPEGWNQSASGFSLGSYSTPECYLLP